MAKTNRPEDREKFGAGEERQDRAFGDREIAEDRTLTDEARFEAELEDEFKPVALPSLPDIPGYHTCWLSTTSTYDPISRRMQLGYELVRASDVPGYEHLSMKGGQFEGAISVNEMIAFKIPLKRHEQIMRYYHHTQPLAEERSIKERQNSMRDGRGRNLTREVEEGTAELGVEPSLPPYFGPGRHPAAR